jgi:hypothetical protein
MVGYGPLEMLDSPQVLLAPGAHIGDHLLELHEADQLRLLNVDRRHNAVHPDLLIGNARFIGKIEQFHAQGGAFVFIARQPIGSPHQGDEVGIVFSGDRHHALVAFWPAHDGIDQMRCAAIFGHLQGGLDGIDIGCVQCQGKIRHNLLNHLHHPGHQFVAIFLGRPEVDVDVVHSFRFLEQGLFLNRFGVALFKCPTDLFVEMTFKLSPMSNIRPPSVCTFTCVFKACRGIPVSTEIRCPLQSVCP